jgi:hypothetical protein
MSNDWRRVAAALADPARREEYARAVLGLPAEHPKRIRALQDAGLLDDSGAPTDRFAQLLSETAVERAEGVDRWLRAGRIDSYPARPADRRELLEWVAARLPAGEFGEREFTEALTAFHDDGVTLRRYLVDAGLVVRDADGSRYRRA